MSDNLKHDVKAFGADFRARREAAGITASNVAACMESVNGRVGLHRTYVLLIERGGLTGLKASTRRRLNEALERAIYNKRRNQGRLEPWTPPAISRKPEAVELFLLFLASVAVGALAVLAYNVMNGG